MNAEVKISRIHIVFVWVLLFVPGFVFNVSASFRETPIVEVVRENSETVVNVSTERIIYLKETPFWGSYGDEFDFFFERFFSPDHPRRAVKYKSVGSGVILEEDGLIVTNAHVVNMASSLYVVLNDGTSVKGRVVYENLENDLAIVKINLPARLRAVKLGDSDDVMVGETVIAIGNPLGLESSVTSGIISGKNRQVYLSKKVRLPKGLLQTDTPINPGNSGGALFNLDGELVGINVAVVQNSQSIGFAVPVDKVKELLAAYRRDERVPIKGENKRPLYFDDSDSRFVQDDDDGDSFTKTKRTRKRTKKIFRDTFFSQSNSPYGSDFNVHEIDGKYVVKLDMDGVDKDKIDVRVNNSFLVVSGERSSSVEEQDSKRVYKSSRYSSFIRTFPLPDDADPEGITTEIDDKAIVITIPKK